MGLGERLIYLWWECPTVRAISQGLEVVVTSTFDKNPLVPRTRNRSRQLVGRGLMLIAPFVLVAAGFDFIHAFPYGLMYDDGYFYAQIAYNLGRLGASTFDGVNVTSGYHLPWGAALGLVSWLVGLLTPSKEAHLYAFQVLFAALALLTARSFFSRRIEQFCAVVLVVMGSLLMETLLLSCLLLMFARLQTRHPEAAERSDRTQLAIAFLVPLVRIDAALILAVYAALRAFDEGIRAVLRLLGAVALGALAQVVLMLAIFGEPFSVSAGIKARSAAPFSERVWDSLVGPEGIALGYLMRSGLFLGLALVTLSLCRVERRSLANRRLFSLGAGAALFSGGHLVSHLIPFWCYLPAYLVLWYGLTRCELRSPTLSGIRRATVVGVALLALAFCGHKLKLHVANHEIARGARDFVARIQDHVPEGGRIYQIDGAGFTGFFSERPVVDGDGLVNSYEYARRMREGRLAGILDEQQICYVITNRRAADGRLVDFGGLVVTESDVEEVFRTSTYGRFPTTDFVLFRRLAPACSEAAR